MNKLSVVLATHDEEKNLARCLNAVKNIADEVVIADGESSDKTVEIARTFNAKIIKTSNKANFHINKQMAIDAANFGLILQLDADEVADNELIEFIANLKKVEKPTTVAWYIKRKNLFLGTWLKKGGQYPDPVIRLFIKGKAELPCKDVHEQMRVEGEVETASGHLLHYANPSFEIYLRKFNHYSSFFASTWYEQKTPICLSSFIKLFIIKPKLIFLSLFLRHKGFVDGIAGFVFALFSGLIYPVAYLKLWELYKKNK